MKLVEMNWNPTARQLRQFGAICVIALPLIGWIWGGSLVVVGWLLAIGSCLALIGVVAPTVLKPIFLALTLVAMPIGIVLGELMILLIYFGVFLPVGLALRLMKRDALNLKIDRQTLTYWQHKKQPSGVASYYRQS